MATKKKTSKKVSVSLSIPKILEPGLMDANIYKLSREIMGKLDDKGTPVSRLKLMLASLVVFYSLTDKQKETVLKVVDECIS